MNRSTRRILFYFLVLAFALVSPVVVLYSLGVTFHPGTATFETTGGVFIKSRTARASVFSDGAFVKETGFLIGSALLTDVTPGTHLVRLEKDNYRPWTKTAAVAPAAVTEFRDVFLVPHIIEVATSTPAELTAARATTTAMQTFTLDKRGRLLLTENGVVETVAERVRAFAPTDAGAFFVEENGFLARYDAARRKAQTIGRPGFFLGREPFRFSDGARFLAIIDSSGGLFLHDKVSAALTPTASGAKEALFDTAEEKLLIVKERQIDVLWLTDNDRQPFQKKGAVETIVKESDTIRQGGWYYATDAHVVYRTRAGVFIAETDTRGGANGYEIVEGPVDELITSPLAPNTIFYRKGKMIYKIEW